jgi:PAS domain S-box-containing protein
MALEQPDPPPSTGQNSVSRFLRSGQFAYYMLAVFNVGVVLFSLQSTRSIVGSFEDLLETNQRWNGRLDEYGRLADLAAAIDAPGNDIFDSRNVAGERRRLIEAAREFEQLRASAVADLQADAGDADAAAVLKLVERLAPPAERTAALGEEVLSAFEAGQRTAAAERMAAMDRAYHELTRGLRDLRQAVGSVQGWRLAREKDALSRAQRNQIVVGASTVLLVAGMVWYGRLLARRTAALREQRRRAERAVAESEKWFRSIVETTAEWIWAIDDHGVFTYSNAGLAAVLGYNPEALRGQSAAALVHPDDQAAFGERIRHAASGRTGWSRVTARWRHRDGTYRYLESNAVPHEDESGRLIGFRGVDRDVTERQRSDQMKSDFVSFVSHQLRTPLAGINWMLELTAKQPGLTVDAQEYIADARESSARLSGLVNDLLDISRLESGRIVVERERVSLPSVTRGVLEELNPLIQERSQNVTFKAGNVVDVLADPKLLRQAMTNLVSNAVKYTPPQGSITISVDTTGEQTIWSIRDTGIGIPPEATARLFEKFFRADNALSLETEGTGLGLYLVRLIVQQLGGAITCESTLGEGTTFTVSLPSFAREAVA